WAFAASRSFYETIATFPPYHEHFIRDICAFLVGIGVALLAALWWRDARFVALLGGTAGAGLLAISHVLDRHHESTCTGPWVLVVFAVLLLPGSVRSWRERHGGGHVHAGLIEGEVAR